MWVRLLSGHNESYLIAVTSRTMPRLGKAPEIHKAMCKIMVSERDKALKQEGDENPESEGPIAASHEDGIGKRPGARFCPSLKVRIGG